MKLSVPNKRFFRNFRKPLLFTAAAGLIYFTGWAAGSGRLILGRNAPNNAAQHLPANLDYSSVETVYDRLKTDFDGELDVTKLMDGLKEGIAKSLDDPYTEYLNAEEAKAFNEDLSGTFTGIGAELGKEEGTVVVISPLAGFPAEKAGLKPKDVIAEINGESAYDLSITEAVKKVRGPKDTKVTLTIVRDGTQELKLEITRAEISIPSVESKTLDNNVGYIKISRFSDDTARLVSEAASGFQRANVSGVILDMRGNPGGLLDAAVDVSGVWLEKGKPILEERRAGLTMQRFKSKGPATLAGIKTVVMINEGSASASEITAGALKDNGVATLVGEKSYGKGSVQQLDDLKDGSVLKVTIARWFTPNGKNIDKEGIEPDEKVTISDDDAKNNRDPQLDKAREILAR